MTEDKVIVERWDGGVALVALNRPDRKNAVDFEVATKLQKVLLELEDDDGVNVIVLTGRGGNFCSGGDLKTEKSGMDIPIEEHRKFYRKFSMHINTMIQMEKPIIAMVDGFAIGGGASLVLACDVVYAADRAKFSWNFLGIGLIPELGASLLLPKIAGLNRAKELLFSAQLITADEAHRLGIVNKVFPSDKLEEETMVFAATVAKMPADVLRMTKRKLNSDFLERIDNTREWESQTAPFTLRTKEFGERLIAFKSSNTRSFVK